MSAWVVVCYSDVCDVAEVLVRAVRMQGECRVAVVCRNGVCINHAMKLKLLLFFQIRHVYVHAKSYLRDVCGMCYRCHGLWCVVCLCSVFAMDVVCDARIIIGVEGVVLLVGRRAWGFLCMLYAW